MPTSRKRKTRTFKGQGLTQPQREHLLFGYSILDGVDFLPFRSEAERKKLYFQHKDELLEATGPDHRPHAWWCYSASEPRRRRVIAGDELKCLWDRGLSFGKCRVYDIESWSDPRWPIFESQKDYLKRLKL